MAYKYSKKAEENCAKAVGVALPISMKQSIMICNHVKGMNLQKAKKILSDVTLLKKAIPFTKYTDGIGHKSGMAAGRFPVKACKNILNTLETAEANAQFKGLSTSDLIIKHISAQQGPKTWHYGRQIRVKAKRAHIEVILEERKARKEVKE